MLWRYAFYEYQGACTAEGNFSAHVPLLLTVMTGWFCLQWASDPVLQAGADLCRRPLWRFSGCFWGFQILPLPSNSALHSLFYQLCILDMLYGSCQVDYVTACTSDPACLMSRWGRVKGWAIFMTSTS